MRKAFLVCAVISGLLVVGCANRKNYSPIPSVSEEAKAKVAKPINCATAKKDISVLESERASVAKQVASGVRSVFPIAAAVGILSGDYRDRVQVATGQYNDDIDNKIADIKKVCIIR
jgi:outer membrane lipoprotein SlyB